MRFLNTEEVKGRTGKCGWAGVCTRVCVRACVHACVCVHAHIGMLFKVVPVKNLNL